VSKRIPARRATLAAAALILSSVVPGLAAPANAEGPTVTVTGVVHNLAGGGLEGDMSLRDATGADVTAFGADSTGAFTANAAPGHYTLHFQTAVPGYSAGFESGDNTAPGLFIDLPVDLSADATFDLTVPIVDFPVHVVDPGGQGVAGVLVRGDSAGPVSLGAGLVAAGRLLNDDAVWTDQNGDGVLQILAGLPPATVAASDAYEQLGQVSPAASDTSAVVTLDNPVLQGQLLDARGPLPAPAVTSAWVAFTGGAYAGQFAPWPYGVGADGHYRLQGLPGDRTLFVSNENVFQHDDGANRSPSATLPGSWRFEAPFHLGGDATLDLTLPDAGPADIVVLGADNQPATGLTLQYSAVAQNHVTLAPGVEAEASATDTITDVAGHLTPMLFGPSTVTYSVENGPSGTVTLSPGDHLTLHLVDQSGKPGAPQNVTATAGDSKVKVAWDAPADDGGSPITGYTVTASHNRSNFTASFGASATSGTIRGLVNGKDYTVTVVAKNANGPGPASAPVTVTLDAAPPTTTTTAPGGPGSDPGSGPGGSGGDPLGGAGSGGDGPGAVQPAAGSGPSGYWLLGSDGTVYSFGDAVSHGDPSASLAATNGSGARAVDLEPTPSGQGYWVLDSRGRIRAFGDAAHLGDAVSAKLAPGETPASLSATPTGAGYWVFTNRGRAIPFGDAAFLGDMTGTTLNGPVLGSVATPSGHGYYMVASDGGIFAFGDARFAGSMGGRRLNAPVRSLVPDGDGSGYWLVASDGGIFAFAAPFRGSMGGQRLNQPVRGMVRYGDGYLMVGEDGGVFNFSDRPFTGSLGARPPASPIVAVAVL
jgi:hypothetical protein